MKHHFSDNPCKIYWAMGSEKYVKDAIRQVKEWLAERNVVLKSKAPSVFPSRYCPELDVSEYCYQSDASFFHPHIGIHRLVVELGRIYLCTKVSMLAAFLAVPLNGHLHALLHIYAYLNTHEHSNIVLDACEFDHPTAHVLDWTTFYPDVEELILPNAPPEYVFRYLKLSDEQSRPHGIMLFTYHSCLPIHILYCSISNPQ